MKRVNIHQAKSDLSRLIAAATKGEEVIIMRANIPVARLVPIAQGRVPGTARGLAHISPDFDAPLPEDFLAEFEG